MRNIAIVLLLSATCTQARAEEFLCTYAWPNQAQSHSALLEVDGKKATMRGIGPLELEFLVAANSPMELLLYKIFTKENSGSDYPVGFTTMALDKQTKLFVYSNAFAGGDQNNHAKGTCEAVRRD